MSSGWRRSTRGGDGLVGRGPILKGFKFSTLGFGVASWQGSCLRKIIEAIG
jgi:hypothetical protein